jgi:DNA-binding beta-propeller fold protein YncE
VIMRSLIGAGVALVLTVSVGATPSAQPAARADSCNQPLHAATEFLPVTGNPFVAIPSHDGCWVFVSEDSPMPGARGVVVFQRSGGTMHIVRTVELPIDPYSMALSHDGHLLVVTAGHGVVFLDVDRLKSRDASPIVGTITDAGQAGAIEVALTPDDRYLFTSFEGSATIGVIDLALAERESFTRAAIVGYIPVGGGPVGLAGSGDGTHLFAVSEAAPAAAQWPLACHPPRLGAQAFPSTAPGALYSIDVAKATRDPAHSVIATTPAGCTPVRVEVSPDGGRTYVTARGDNAVLVFETQKLLSADAGSARVGQVEVGTAPVGMAFIDQGRRLVVANSNRFQGSAGSPQSLAVIETARLSEGAAAVVGAIPAGLFPRELHVSADGATLFVANYSSQALEVVDLANGVTAFDATKPLADADRTRLGMATVGSAPGPVASGPMLAQNQAAAAPAQAPKGAVGDVAAADLAAAAEDAKNAADASAYVDQLAGMGDQAATRLAASRAAVAADTAAAAAETAAAAVETDAAKAAAASVAGDRAALKTARDKATEDNSALLAADAELAKAATDLTAASAGNAAFFAAANAGIAAINDMGAQDSSAVASLLSAITKGGTAGYSAAAANEASAVKDANTVASLAAGRALAFQAAAKAEASAQSAATAAAAGGSASAAAAALAAAATAGAIADEPANPYAGAVEIAAAAVANAASATISAQQAMDRLEALK